MNVSFCSDCDNLLYLYKDDDTGALYNCCKSCGSKDKLNETAMQIYTTDKSSVDKLESINHNLYVSHDVTLPTIINNPTIKCHNVDCEYKNVIKYIKYDDDNMKFIYICNNCGSKWINSL